jgi:hypothetical protein
MFPSLFLAFLLMSFVLADNPSTYRARNVTKGASSDRCQYDRGLDLHCSCKPKI